MNPSYNSVFGQIWTIGVLGAYLLKCKRNPC